MTLTISKKEAKKMIAAVDSVYDSMIAEEFDDFSTMVHYLTEGGKMPQNEIRIFGVYETGTVITSEKGGEEFLLARCWLYHDDFAILFCNEDTEIVGAESIDRINRHTVIIRGVTGKKSRHPILVKKIEVVSAIDFVEKLLKPACESKGYPVELVLKALTFKDLEYTTCPECGLNNIILIGEINVDEAMCLGCIRSRGDIEALDSFTPTSIAGYQICSSYEEASKLRKETYRAMAKNIFESGKFEAERVSLSKKFDSLEKMQEEIESTFECPNCKSQDFKIKRLDGFTDMECRPCGNVSRIVILDKTLIEGVEGLNNE